MEKCVKVIKAIIKWLVKAYGWAKELVKKVKAE